MDDMMTEAELIDQLIDAQPLDEEYTIRYNKVKNGTKHLLMTILENCPTNTDRLTAIRKLRECYMFAGSSIARPMSIVL